MCGGRAAHEAALSADGRGFEAMLRNALRVVSAMLVDAARCAGALLCVLAAAWARTHRGRYTREVHDYEVVVPRKVNPDGSFLSFDLPHFYDASRARRSADLTLRVHYALSLAGDELLLELRPNVGFISPGLVVERRRREVNRTRLRRVRARQCHYRGHARRVRSAEGPGDSRAALSVCAEGMVGYFRTPRGDTYFVEPSAASRSGPDGRQIHVVYQRAVPDPRGRRGCYVDDDWRGAWERRVRWEMQLNPSFEAQVGSAQTVAPGFRAGTVVPRFIEVAVVADKKFIQYHKDDDMESYILTVMNMVSDFYHDASVGASLNVIVVRIIYLEKEEEEIDLTINPNAEDTLESFCKWALNVNPADENHPNHHDIAVLFTRYDICSDNLTNCNLMGLAFVGTACNDPEACCINEDSGLLLGVVTAHEMGHVMGCSHDTEEISGCPPEAEDNSAHVMSPYVQLHTIRWSNCSKRFMNELIENKLAECLVDEPQDHLFKEPDMLPGVMYDAGHQCHDQFGVAEVCPGTADKMCESLWCRTSADSCSTHNVPAADGSKCGENKWCYQLKCVEAGRRPAAVDGGWGPWSEFKPCSRTCGGGVQVQERVCNNPTPQNRGRFCLGERKRYRMCQTNPCEPTAPTFREVQCSAFDSVPWRGKLYVWKPLVMKGRDPCELMCINDERKSTTLAPRVKDGTPCKVGTKNVCVGGICRRVGCDWGLDSDAVTDSCGVCRGDGSQCKLVEGVFNQTDGQGYVPFAVVPPDSHNLKVEELKPAANIIAVAAKDGTFFLNGNYIEMQDGQYKFGGRTIGVYSHPEPERELLVIKGPTSEELHILVGFFGSPNPGVRYEYWLRTFKGGVSASGSAPAAGKGVYDWEFVDWGPCSKRCGGGTEQSTPSCVEKKSGKVSASFCANKPKPEAQSRVCNKTPCRPRWRLGPWSKCSGCIFRTGQQMRTVDCVKENPQNAGGDEILAEADDCKALPKPPERQICSSKVPCPAGPSPMVLKDDDLVEKDDVGEAFRSMLRSVPIPQLAPMSQPQLPPNLQPPPLPPSPPPLPPSPPPLQPSTPKTRRPSLMNSPKSKPVLDRVPPGHPVLKEAPLVESSLAKSLSEEAEEQLGEHLAETLDTTKTKVYKGEKAIDKGKKIKEESEKQKQCPIGG